MKTYNWILSGGVGSLILKKNKKLKKTEAKPFEKIFYNNLPNMMIKTYYSQLIVPLEA